MIKEVIEIVYKIHNNINLILIILIIKLDLIL